ncbi:MAG: transcription antitermination factor NusB [Endomicrobia bacterium]|nr:transcription antitermination factor NusB [Endomicrobiia bacterium]
MKYKNYQNFNNKKFKLTFRRQARLFTLNVLYIIDLGNLSTHDGINFVFSEQKNYPEPIKKYASYLVIATIQNLKLIDEVIKKTLKNWTIDRLNIVDKNILRLATCEFLCCLETPICVIINEAIEIAKSYSTADSGRFVNAILDKIKYIREDDSLVGRFKHPENSEECKKLFKEVEELDQENKNLLL